LKFIDIEFVKSTRDIIALIDRVLVKSKIDWTVDESSLDIERARKAHHEVLACIERDYSKDAVVKADCRGKANPSRRVTRRKKRNPSSMDVANTILAHMGGAGRLKAMIGAKDFVGDTDSLAFKWSAKTKNDAKMVKVTLLPSDTYDMKFYKRAKKVAGYAGWKSTAEIIDLHAADLIPAFEQKTGLTLRL